MSQATAAGIRMCQGTFFILRNSLQGKKKSPALREEEADMSEKPKYYITTAIAYTSGKPHIGNTYEIVLADAIAR